MNAQREQEQQLNAFLAEVEKKAYRMAEMATQNNADALDIVQDAMLAFVKNYAHKSKAEWPPLFYRIVQNKIMDYHRKNTNRGKWWRILSSTNEEDEIVNPIEQFAGPQSFEPSHRSDIDAATEQLLAAIKTLPIRQQQAFLLRSLEGLNVEHTAQAMACSTGSVKTHYSRAMTKLKALLGEHWP